MDRCHRIGQVRDVHVYRLISEHTIEECIWKKQLQKRQLDDVVVDQGKFTDDWFSNSDSIKQIFMVFSYNFCRIQLILNMMNQSIKIELYIPV